jgi:hypothetical protein
MKTHSSHTHALKHPPQPQGIDVDPNVNFTKVTLRLEGYSGDDITNICRWGARRCSFSTREAGASKQGRPAVPLCQPPFFT